MTAGRDERRYTPADLAAVSRWWWTDAPDPVRPPETDEEPWSVTLPDAEPRSWSVFGREDLAGWWVIATAAVAAALAAVLVVIGLERALAATPQDPEP